MSLCVRIEVGKSVKGIDSFSSKLQSSKSMGWFGWGQTKNETLPCNSIVDHVYSMQ